MSIAGKIARGKKWDRLRGLSDYAKENIEASEGCMADIEFYFESIKPAPVAKSYSSMTKAELEAACDAQGIYRSDATTNADLIALLEGTSEPQEA